jgi:hypothetical protein
MTETEAIDRAQALLKLPIDVNTGRELRDLGGYMSDRVYSDLIEAMIAASPRDVLAEMQDMGII